MTSYRCRATLFRVAELISGHALRHVAVLDDWPDIHQEQYARVLYDGIRLPRSIDATIGGVVAAVIDCTLLRKMGMHGAQTR
mmetsp:Transcript_6497/g.20281  ORF Transcript_6497/g.20281 Transcript_6497/m.20281 type:complete len:82 (+) Transcript_6497:783-1028(+)|eukprot:scaffold53635_cov35-Tisochrysis_lutea.AAC.2